MTDARLAGESDKVRIGVARLGDDVHPRGAGDVHDRGVLGEAVHEKRRHGSIAGMLGRAREQRPAGAPPAMLGQNGDAELGDAVGEGNVGDADERERVVENPEHRVAPQIDLGDVGRNPLGRERGAEAQPAVVGGQREEVGEERGPWPVPSTAELRAVETVGEPRRSIEAIYLFEHVFSPDFRHRSLVQCSKLC